MLFLWSREPAATATISASPRAGPWFAWFATAVLLWRCRRRIVRAVLGPASPLRLLKRRQRGATTVVVSKAHHHQRRHHHVSASAPATSAGEQRRVYHQIKYHPTSPSTSPSVQKPKQLPKPQPAVLRRCDVNAAAAVAAAAKSRFRRMAQAGDGPHMTVTAATAAAGRKLAVSASCVQISQQLYYRVTRSGRVYGKYPRKQHATTVK